MPISPTDKDIGRGVLYKAQHEGASDERGIITSFNEHFVFVRFRGMTSQACDPGSLEWEHKDDATGK